MPRSPGKWKRVECGTHSSSPPRKGPSNEYPVCSDCERDLEEQDREMYRRLGLRL
jgi:hypothetical protein